MQILEDNNIVIGADGIDLPEHIRFPHDPTVNIVLYGPYYVDPIIIK